MDQLCSTDADNRRSAQLAACVQDQNVIQEINMTRKTANDFPPEVMKLFDEYVHGIIPRRTFLSGAAKFAVAGLTAEGLLEALSPKFAQAEQIAKDDPRIKASYIEIPSPDGYGNVRGYLVQP